MCNVPYCERKRHRGFTNEIIQIGAALLNESLEVCDTFMSYVQPEFGVIDSLDDLAFLGMKHCDAVIASVAVR